MKKAALTKARTDSGRAMFKGDPLQYPAAVQARYADALARLVNQMLHQYQRDESLTGAMQHSFTVKEEDPMTSDKKADFSGVCRAVGY